MLWHEEWCQGGMVRASSISTMDCAHNIILALLYMDCWGTRPCSLLYVSYQHHHSIKGRHDLRLPQIHNPCVYQNLCFFFAEQPQLPHFLHLLDLAVPHLVQTEVCSSVFSPI